MLEYNPIKLQGRFREGHALDLHTLSSVPIGHNEAGYMQFDTTRPPVAERLYAIKYRQDYAVASEIVEVAADFLRGLGWKYHWLVPVPPSTTRTRQPVLELAEQVAKATRAPFGLLIEATRSTSALKGVTDPDERAKLLDGLYQVTHAHAVAGKDILLFDDVYRSGATMNAIAEVLYAAGAHCVDALTITKTRSNR